MNDWGHAEYVQQAAPYECSCPTEKGRFFDVSGHFLTLTYSSKAWHSLRFRSGVVVIRESEDDRQS